MCYREFSSENPSGRYPLQSRRMVLRPFVSQEMIFLFGEGGEGGRNTATVSRQISLFYSPGLLRRSFVVAICVAADDVPVVVAVVVGGVVPAAVVLVPTFFFLFGGAWLHHQSHDAATTERARNKSETRAFGLSTADQLPFITNGKQRETKRNRCKRKRYGYVRLLHLPLLKSTPVLRWVLLVSLI